MHGLSRAKYRGLQKMQIQAHMISATQNLKRLVISLIPAFITVLLEWISLKFWKSVICTIKYKISHSFFIFKILNIFELNFLKSILFQQHRSILTLPSPS